MKKTTLVSFLLWGSQSVLDAQESNDLKKSILNYIEENKIKDTNAYAEGLIDNFPQFQIMHNYFIRKKIDSIANGIATIKLIVVIYFVCSIIGALLYFANAK